MTERCRWAEHDPLLIAYHDEQWGTPVHDGRALWESLVLVGFQAGLSWLTILRKRDAFRRAFGGFDPRKVARYGDRQIERLMNDAGIVRSRPKILAAVANARAYVALEEEVPFARWVWELDRDAELVSGALEERGFTFAGPTITYAWMTEVGLIDAHEAGCFRRKTRSRGR